MTDPVVRWSPVPGASEYTLTFIPWTADGGCSLNGDTSTTTTPATAWTPGAGGENANWEGVLGWPGGANAATNLGLAPGPYCISLIALRNASPLAGSTIESDPTVDGNSSAPAFTYQLPSGSGTLDEADSIPTYSPGLVPPAYGSAAVGAGSTLSTTPLFEWQPVSGATGYYVVIANDAGFSSNSIVTGGYTNTTAWAPPTPLPDQTGAYWWEVIPVNQTVNLGAPLLNPEGGYNPQPFNKSSTPPTPISPVGGANVPTQPTFSWHSAQGAVSYTLEISADPSFASPIESDSTNSTSFTSGSTLPAGKTLYWRVRANDVSYNLNWSAVQTFTHNLPAPSRLPSSPTSGTTIPLLSWTPVTGASSYNIQITTAAGTSTQSVDTPYMTPLEFFSPGLSSWQVQSVFPGGAASAYSGLTAYKRSIPAPNGIHATKSGSRILVTWTPDPIAKSYVIQLSPTTGFGSPLASDTTVNTAWVPQITAVQARTKLYWRLAVVDEAGNVGAYHTGVFKGPAKHKAKPKKKKR
jgi:hypothetical protein